MKQKSYSVSMFWNTRSMDSKTKQGQISLTVNLPGNQFRVSLKLVSIKADYLMALSTSRKISDEVKELRKAMNDYMMKGEAILDRLKEPSKEVFVRLFRAESDLFALNKTNVDFFYQIKMDEALKEERIGTYKYFKNCRNCLNVYSPNVCFELINEKWLKNYQLYLKGKGNSNATISMKFVCLRIIFNAAIKDKFISSSLYPFKNFSIASYGKSKSVLYPTQLKALYEYVPKGIVEKRAKDYFFFCYLGNGLNFKDMTLLKYKDIKGESFTFIREKTKLSCRSGVKEIRVYM